MAAVLAGGEGAVLSHRSAGALWGIAAELGRRVEISVPRRLHQRGPEGEVCHAETDTRSVEVRLRSRPSLSPSDRTARHGIPVTAPARTLLDLVTCLSPQRLERAVNEADKYDLIGPVELRAALDRFRGQPGVTALRTLLEPEAFRLSDSDLEILFRPIAASAGLPPPLTKQIINGFEVDFYWPELGIVVETDGLRYHRTPSAQTRDRIRDQTHTAAGLAQLRFTHWQIKHEPAYVVRILRRTAG